MNNDIVLRIVSKIITPFIVIYAFYIQVHGELSPGGGFQAGAVLASAFILHSIIFGDKFNLKIFKLDLLKLIAAFGVMIYATTGLISLFFGLNYLDYSYLHSDKLLSQKLGIMIVELGVGITVFSVMLVIFFSFANRKNK